MQVRIFSSVAIRHSHIDRDTAGSDFDMLLSHQVHLLLKRVFIIFYINYHALRKGSQCVKSEVYLHSLTNSFNKMS